MMFEEHHQQIRSEALSAYPNEAVWLITKSGIRQVENTADEPTRTFRVSKQDLAKAHIQGLLAVVHSHPDYPACPSELDMKSQVSSDVPWGIVATNGESATEVVFWGDQVEKEDLIGRRFRHGITDCYSLIRDYYLMELGVTLPEFPRSWEWWKDKDLYSDGFATAGFRRVLEGEPLQPGDMFIAQIRSTVPNHGGVILENGLILHHPGDGTPVAGTLSRREPMERWRGVITGWYRHETQETS